MKTFLGYNYKFYQEMFWTVVVAILTYLVLNIGNVQLEDWGNWGKIWAAVGIGLVRAVLGAVLAAINQGKRHKERSRFS